MIQMLTLLLPVRDDAMAQKVATDVRDGFTLEQWTALRTFGVLDARITSVPNGKDGFSHIILCTTYVGQPEPYYKFFWDLMRIEFLLLALATPKPPFALNEAQLAALTGPATADNLAVLKPLYEPFRDWITNSNLTAEAPTPEQAPPSGQRRQFHAYE